MMRVPTRASFALCVAVSCILPGHAHEGHDHAENAVPQVRSDSSVPTLRGVRLENDGVLLPKPAQFRLAIKTRQLRDASETRELTLAAEVIPDPGHSARIASTERGLLMPPPQGYPRVGQKVAKGEIVAYLEPFLDEADLIRRRAELARTEQELVINEQGLAQLGAQIRNQVSIATTTIYHKNLQNDRERLIAKLRTVKQSLTGKTALRAPVAGELSLARAQAGALVDDGELIFEILEPDRIWVEATSFDRIDTPGIERAEVKTRDGSMLPLRFVGQGLSTTGQAFPLEFDFADARPALRVGERLNVQLRLRTAQQGLVLPISSVSRLPNGQTRVWLQTAAEIFTPRTVKTEVLPGDRVLIAAGLAVGDRVVIEGGWLLDQIR